MAGADTEQLRRAIANQEVAGSTGLYPREDGDLNNIADLRHLAGLLPLEDVGGVAIPAGFALDGDIKMEYDPILGGQVFVKNGDLLRDRGLKTAVLISLLTDRLAETTDVLPDNSGNRRGWWAEPKLGSRLWLLFRSSLTTDIPSKIEAFTREALQWMINEGAAKNINVIASIVIPFQVNWTIEVIKPGNKDNTNFKFFFNWENEIFGEG